MKKAGVRVDVFDENGALTAEPPEDELLALGRAWCREDDAEAAVQFRDLAESYLRAKTLARGTRNEYFCTLRKWEAWGEGPTDRGVAAQAHP